MLRSWLLHLPLMSCSQTSCWLFSFLAGLTGSRLSQLNPCFSHYQSSLDMTTSGFTLHQNSTQVKFYCFSLWCDLLHATQVFDQHEYDLKMMANYLHWFRYPHSLAFSVVLDGDLLNAAKTYLLKLKAFVIGLLHGRNSFLSNLEERGAMLFKIVHF